VPIDDRRHTAQLVLEVVAMHGALIKIVVKPGKRNEVLEFLRFDAAVAQAAEPGTLRFDVWEVPHEPDALFLYEAYTDEEALAKHKANTPFKTYIDVIEPSLLDKSREHRLVEFTDSLISNIDALWPAPADQPAMASSALRDSSSGLTKLSFGSFPIDEAALAHFNHYAELRRLAPERNASVAHVHFPPGVRTDWHRHTGQQLLWFIDGEGEVALRDRSVECRAGDLVRVNANLSHWHGASTEHAATHIAITIGNTVWQERPLLTSN
jgi:quercetin dioxygenase-like cupin family protein/quinol monooxygenase YgiN